MAERLELVAQLEVVEDLAVVQQLQRAVLARERLAARVGEVDDRQPRVAESYTRRLEEAVSVRPAVTQLVGHRAHGVRFRRTAEPNDSADPAHT